MSEAAAGSARASRGVAWRRTSMMATASCIMWAAMRWTSLWRGLYILALSSMSITSRWKSLVARIVPFSTFRFTVIRSMGLRERGRRR